MKNKIYCSICFCLSIIGFMGCKRNNIDVLVQVPSTQYSIEYKTDSIKISFGLIGETQEQISLFFKNGQYYDLRDTSLFLLTRDTSVILYNTHKKEKYLRFFEKINDSVYVAETFQVPYNDNDVYDKYYVKEVTGVKSLVSYYYDSTYQIEKIHRGYEIDDYVMK